MIFGTNFLEKVYFRTKSEKSEHRYWVLHIQISPSTNFQLKLIIEILWTKFAQVGVAIFSLKHNRHHHWILHIRISLCIKFHFEQTILNFWTKFTQERYLCSKTEKVNIIEFRIFKLVLVPSFSLNWQCWFFWLDLPKKGFSVLKQKKCTPHIFFIILHIQISLVRNFSSNWEFDELILWIKFAQKDISSRKQEKWISPWHYAYLN